MSSAAFKIQIRSVCIGEFWSQLNPNLKSDTSSWHPGLLLSDKKYLAVKKAIYEIQIRSEGIKGVGVS